MTIHFSLLLLILAVTQASPSCDWFAAAQTNPALDYFSKVLLWRIWQLDQVCKKTFHLLPASSLPYVSTYLPENKDKVGPFLQFYADKVEEELIHNWISNYTYTLRRVKFELDSEEMTKEAIMTYDRDANRTMASLKNFRTYIFEKIEEGNIYNTYNTLRDPDNYRDSEKFKTLKIEEWLVIYDALYCTLTSRNSSESSVDLTVFRQMMNINGLENTDEDRIKPVLVNLTDKGINVAIDMVQIYQEKMETFLYSFTEDMKAYENTVLQILDGKLPESTNLIFEILGQVKSEMFFQNIDSLFNAICDQRLKNIWNPVDTAIAKLISKFDFLSNSINAKNNLDVFIFISALNSNVEEVKKEMQKIIERGFNALKSMLNDQENAKLIIDTFLPIFFPACKEPNSCQEKKRILLKQSKILVGWILRSFVKMERFDKSCYSKRQTDGSYKRYCLCWVDCSRDCPDIEKDNYREGCKSLEACTKNLFYDAEKC